MNKVPNDVRPDRVEQMVEHMREASSVETWALIRIQVEYDHGGADGQLRQVVAEVLAAVDLVQAERRVRLVGAR